MARRKKEPVLLKVPAKRGRPEFKPTKEMRDSVELMVASGILQDDIAGSLGISDVTLRKHFADEIAHGQTRINTIVARRHVDLIKEGEFPAIKWWQQARMGWSDKTVIVDERPPQTRVVIELVGSPPSDVRTIDQTGAPSRQDNALRNAIEFVGKNHE